MAVKGSPGDGDIGLADVGAAELFPAAAVLGGDGRGGVVLRRMALLVGPASVCLGPLLWVAGPCLLTLTLITYWWWAILA